MVEHQRRVHEAARINQAASLTNLHFFYIEYEATVENMESRSTLATEQKNFVVSDLMGQSHIRGNPLGLVDFGSRDLLPNIS